MYGLLLGLVILHKRESDGLFDHSVTGIEAPVIWCMGREKLSFAVIPVSL